jgi:hypothetical protein
VEIPGHFVMHRKCLEGEQWISADICVLERAEGAGQAMDIKRDDIDLDAQLKRKIDAASNAPGSCPISPSEDDIQSEVQPVATNKDQGLSLPCEIASTPGGLRRNCYSSVDLCNVPRVKMARNSWSSQDLCSLGSRVLNDNDLSHWSLRPVAANDALLRDSFRQLLEESEAVTVPEDRLVMYDACDDEEVKEEVGFFRKRLDARRNTKPKKPEAQLRVCTPFDAKGFNFSKIRNERERVLRLQFPDGQYDVLSNKFPLFPRHMLLVCRELVAQQMTMSHLKSLTSLLQATSFCAYFNSWCASASVNHFHCHLIDEHPPVTAFPLVSGPTVGMMAKPDGTPLPGCRTLSPQGFPGFCYVYPTGSALVHVDAAIRAMQADNQPHNLLFTPRFVYVFPKPLVRPERSAQLYPETVGGPELIGSFTVYGEGDYAALSARTVEELVRINTAPLPSRLLQRGGTHGGSVDDHAVHSTSTIDRAEPATGKLPRVPSGKHLAGIPMAHSVTFDCLPRM